MRTRIKFCGCTSIADAELAVAAGVDAIGVIFAADSPRRIALACAREIAAAVPPFTDLVAVFVDPTLAEIDEVVRAGFTPQFSGDEPAALTEASQAMRYVKVYRVAPDAVPDPLAFATHAQPFVRATWMFETHVAGRSGGTGIAFDWERAREFAGERPIIVSGGLTPENVGDCVRRVRPYAVDVRSGIETAGAKDLAKMRAFVRAVKEADA
jgi:phosphoribosylanthranilate isomerase